MTPDPVTTHNMASNLRNFSEGDWNVLLYHAETCEDLVRCMRKVLALYETGGDMKDEIQGMEEEIYAGLASLTLLTRDVRKKVEESSPRPPK